MKILLPSLVLLLAVTAALYPQSRDIKLATKRADRATKVMGTFSSTFGNGSIPANLLKKAKAVAIMEIGVVDHLLSKNFKGHGILMFHEESGWSSPTFVACNGGRMEWGRSPFWPKKTVDVVFLFMDDGSFGLIKGWLSTFKESVPKVTGKEIALGPVVNGKGADFVASTASVIYYGFEGDKLSGEEFPNSALGSTFKIDHDDAMNKRVFHKKFQKIRSSSATTPVPQPLLDLQRSMNDQFGGE